MAKGKKAKKPVEVKEEILSDDEAMVKQISEDMQKPKESSVEEPKIEVEKPKSKRINGIEILSEYKEGIYHIIRDMNNNGYKLSEEEYKLLK